MTISLAGINVTDVFCEYVNILKNALHTGVLYRDFVSQLTAINMYEFYHAEMLEKLNYFIKRNGFERKLNFYTEEYYSYVLKKCKLIRILYLKLCCQIERNISTEKTLNSIYSNLENIKKKEYDILCDFVKESKKLVT